MVVADKPSSKRENLETDVLVNIEHFCDRLRSALSADSFV